jgi:hypothetical protein
MTTRMRLLKIPEIPCGPLREGDRPKGDYPFFISLEFESMEKLQMTQEDAIYMKFISDVVRANTAERLVLNYEMEAGKNVKYSLERQWAMLALTCSRTVPAMDVSSSR